VPFARSLLAIIVALIIDHIDPTKGYFWLGQLFNQESGTGVRGAWG
jgi:hypothetical protein